MQFIYASDKQKGYTVLYSDAPPSNAERVYQILKIPTPVDIDVFGFTTFGTNGNQPLFFKIQADRYYSRDAYFVHAIYHQAEKQYFAQNQYKLDLFSTMLTQEQLEEMRSKGFPKQLSLSVDSSLDTAVIPINMAAFREALIRIYASESFIIGVDDDVFSHNYVRSLMALLFKFIPPSLRKACSFISGTLNVGDENDFKIRIVPKSKLTDYVSPWLDICGGQNIRPSGSIFGDVVDWLFPSHKKNSGEELSFGAFYGLCEKSRFKSCKILFDDYEQHYDGFNSYYRPKQLYSFLKAIGGDVEAAEKVLNDILEKNDNPSQGSIPLYLQEKMKSKYGSFEDFKGAFRISGADDCFSPRVLLKKNADLLKKRYVVLKSDEYQSFISKVLNEKVDAISLNNESMEHWKDKFSRPVQIPTENIPTYQREFYDIVSSTLQKLKERVDTWEKTKEDAFKRVDELVGNAQSMPSQRRVYDNIAEDILTPSSLSSEDLKSLREMVWRRIGEAIKEWQRLCKEQEKTQTVNRLKKALNSGDTEGALEIFDEVRRDPEAYGDEIDAPIIKYIMKRAIYFPKHDFRDAFLEYLAKDSQTWCDFLSGAVNKTKAGSPKTEVIQGVLCLAIACADRDSMPETVCRLIVDIQDQLEDMEAEGYWSRMKEVLYDLYYSFNEYNKQDLSTIFEQYMPHTTGNSRLLMEKFRDYLIGASRIGVRSSDRKNTASLYSFGTILAVLGCLVVIVGILLGAVWLNDQAKQSINSGSETQETVTETDAVESESADAAETDAVESADNEQHT